MNADSLPVFSLDPWKTPDTHAGLAKLANFIGARTFSCWKHWDIWLQYRSSVAYVEDS